MLRIFGYSVARRAKRSRRQVSTWSPLATVFNSNTSIDLGFKLSSNKCGLFGIPQLTSPCGFSDLQEEAILASDRLIAEATGPSRTRKMVRVFDDLSDTLCRVADLAEFVRIAHPRRDFAEAAEEACLAVSGIVEKLNTHRGLYNALSHVVKRGDIVKTTETDDHVSKLFLFDFEQCGIHLPEEERRRVVELNDLILQVGQRFMAGAVTARSIKGEALPENIRQYFTNNNGEILVHGLYTDSSNALAREAAYKIFLYPDEEQENLLRELLNSRHRLARICGFDSYAHRAIKGSTVETPSLVHDFLHLLNASLSDRALSDFRQMQKMKNHENSSFKNANSNSKNSKSNLMAWDTGYFTSKAKKSWLNASNNDFSPFFSIGDCMEGLNILTQNLYGIRLENSAIFEGEIWANDVKKLAVVEEKNGEILGYIYCDFYEREGKPNQDCHFTIRGGRELEDGSYQNPIVVLMLSLPPPRWSNPCLLTPSSVDNLFHEMGHALHSMLGRTKYQHVTGTRCSSDFAEVPSVLMEYFASDPRVVRLFAKHFETREPMPEPMLQKLCASKNLFPASELQIQVFYSMLDQVYHSRELRGTSTEVLKDIQGEFYGLPYVENTAWQLRFSHLVGYGAKYYSYLISRAIASWIWQTYFQADPLSRCAGEKYRRDCLSHGGGKPPSKLVSDFLNKEANAQHFANSLITEIDMKNEHIEAVKKSIA